MFRRARLHIGVFTVVSCAAASISAERSAFADKPAAQSAAPKPGPAAADARQAGDPVVSALERFGRSIQRVTLDNGLRVVLNPDSSSPTVAVAVTYGVG